MSLGPIPGGNQSSVNNVKMKNAQNASLKKSPELPPDDVPLLKKKDPYSPKQLPRF